MQFKCPICAEAVPDEVRLCIVCKGDAGFPNVRRALKLEEREELARRVDLAEREAEARGAEKILQVFRARVANSHCVMNRNLAALQTWSSSDSPYFISFHTQLRDRSILAREDSNWDQQRISAENTINPIYFSELEYAALSLDNKGLSYYGQYCVTLKEAAIELRASVFEENPFYFNQKHKIVSGQMAPFGFRASWNERAKLAVAKLAHRIDATTKEAEFPFILMGIDRDKADCDFIEVHIHDKLHRKTIQSVSGPRPIRDLDKALWEVTKERLETIGVSIEEF